MSEDIVFFTWFMKDYGTAYLGLAPALFVNKAPELVSNEDLVNDWAKLKKNIKITCLFPKYYENKANEHREKNKNKEKEVALNALEKKDPMLLSKDFWYLSHLMEYKNQLTWFQNVWGDNFTVKKLDNIAEYEDMCSVEKVLKETKEVLEDEINKNKDKTIIINFHNTPTEFQIACYILASEAAFAENIKFCKFFDDKDDTNTKSRKIKYIELPKNPLVDYYKSHNGFKNYTEVEQEVFKKLSYFISQQQNFFTILLLGERGTGKTRIVNKLGEESKDNENIKKVYSANCSYFPDSNITEAELFGTTKEAYTGAKLKDGLFKKANDNILFLDEIHHLDKRAQAKLLTALQTNSKGQFSFKKMGSAEEEKSRFQLICASNLTLPELKEKLHPDFFDRISQRIIEIPNIEKINKQEAFESVWTAMKFKKDISIPPTEKKKILNWIENISLQGNYRSLEQIVISISDYLGDKENAYFHHEDGLFGYVKEEYEKRNAVKVKTIATELTNDFESAQDFVKMFKKSLSQYFLQKNGNIQKKAYEEMNIARGTFEKWIKMSN